MRKPIKFLIIIATIMVMMCFSVHSSARGERPEPVVKGDANLDGAINALDVITVKKIIIGMEQYNKNADLVNDGVVNAKDLLYFNKLMVGIPYGDEDVSMTVFSVDRKTFQNFLDNMSVDVLRNSEGSYVEDHIIEERINENETEIVFHRTYLKTGETILELNESYEMYYTSSYLGYFVGNYVNVGLYNDPDQLKALFSEQGINMTESPETVCMIDTTFRYPIVWVKCGEENYFLEYIENETFQIVQKAYTEEEYLAYAKERKATLLVNGVEKEDEHAVILEEYCIVSFTSLLESIGAQVEWTGERYAEIIHNGERYVLKEHPDYHNHAVFYGIDNDVNYDFTFLYWDISPCYQLEWVENDLLIFDVTIRYLLAELVNDGEYDSSVLSADFDNDIIIINYSEE
ncbi:MAG: dockerin type I repeat-containing protein [Clostridia bacterium]|nr:dockerin type I repeat-containing protein [Clostridia bacterium]